jgi:hypothetical protein
MSGTKSFSDFDLPGKARNVQKQPVIGGGICGGICLTRSHETAGIPGLSILIAVPSRGASKINKLRFFPPDLLHYLCIGN